MTLNGDTQSLINSHAPAKLIPITAIDEASTQLCAQDFISLDELLAQINLTRDQLPALDTPATFRFKTTRHFASNIAPSDANDPLLLQILPVLEEHLIEPGFSEDPLDEAHFTAVPGLIHKYPSRVLLTVTGACAIHCRYCFRRHFDYQQNLPSSEKLEQMRRYIQSRPEINEVILSGGDPLVLSDQALIELLRFFESIEQIDTMRIHSRLPILKPSRLRSPFFNALKNSRLSGVLVIHSNHPAEIDEVCQSELLAVKPKLSALLNQSVLLKGVNDSSTVLAKLSNRLFAAGVLPYYLHLLDPVQGAGHFKISDERAKIIFNELQLKLPGYLLPKLVQEQAGELHKSLIN
jgi:EF-P beta-lysylation protein EpmB